MPYEGGAPPCAPKSSLRCDLVRYPPSGLKRRPQRLLYRFFLRMSYIKFYGMVKAVPNFRRSRRSVVTLPSFAPLRSAKLANYCRVVYMST